MKFYPYEKGGAKSFGPAIYPFCSPPLPVINEQSLSRSAITVYIYIYIYIYILPDYTITCILSSISLYINLRLRGLSSCDPSCSPSSSSSLFLNTSLLERLVLLGLPAL